jgi:hypothetical protein
MIHLPHGKVCSFRGLLLGNLLANRIRQFPNTSLFIDKRDIFDSMCHPCVSYFSIELQLRQELKARAGFYCITTNTLNTGKA